jgi:hypothetical protein
VPDPEAAADVDRPRQPVELVAAAVGELREQRHREQMRAHVGELRADVDVQALDVEPGGKCGADRLDRVVLVQPELGAAMAGADGLVRLRLDAGGHADEDATHARLGGTRGLVERVQHDERPGLGRGTQLLVRLVVPVHEQALTRDPGPLREGQLPECRDVRAEPFLGEQAHQSDVRKRLRPVDDERIGSGPLEHPRALAHRILCIDDEGGPEPLRQVGHGDPVELQHARRDPGSAREQC